MCILRVRTISSPRIGSGSRRRAPSRLTSTGSETSASGSWRRPASCELPAIPSSLGGQHQAGMSRSEIPSNAQHTRQRRGGGAQQLELRGGQCERQRHHVPRKWCPPPATKQRGGRACRFQSRAFQEYARGPCPCAELRGSFEWGSRISDGAEG